MSSRISSHRTIWTALTDLPPTFGRRLCRVALYSVIVAALLAAAMGTVTYKLAGAAGVTAMFVALVICLLSHIAGTVPACWSLGTSARSDAKNLLSGMVVRLVVLLILVLPTLLSDALPTEPFLLWIAGAYMLLLLVETTLVAAWINQDRQVEP